MPIFTDALPTFFFSPNYILFVPNSRISVTTCRKFFPLNLARNVVERNCMLLSLKGSSGILSMCRGLESEGEGDFALEAEILEFMKNSKNPDAFPSKKDLVENGRWDLVEGIVKKGGWLSLGWNLDDDEENEDQSFGELGHSESGEIHRFGASPLVYSSPSSFAGRTIEMVAEDLSGIEGMLSRLEKERNETFGVGFPCSVGKNDLHSETTAKETAADLHGSAIITSVNVKEGEWNDSEVNLSQNSSSSRIYGLRDSVSPEGRRTWIPYRGELQDGSFQASESASSKGRSEEALDVSRDETVGFRGEFIQSKSRQEEISYSQIRSHLQHLELELSSVMHSLRSAETFVSEKGQNSDDLLKLSDALEFQENEILNAKDSLRSIRAKLAILDGKIALKRIDSQKTIEEKQKRINSAHRALLMLRTAYVPWHNSASEVLLAGSFDGWVTQRKMEKSSAGVFSLSLKLYPGRYEIKFIVDGEWKIDPLRPIVNSGGHQNNLLIVT